MCNKNSSSDNVIFNSFSLQSKNNKNKLVEILVDMMWQIMRLQLFSNKLDSLSGEKVPN